MATLVLCVVVVDDSHQLSPRHTLARSTMQHLHRNASGYDATCGSVQSTHSKLCQDNVFEILS
jgi:hypothetical protein